MKKALMNVLLIFSIFFILIVNVKALDINNNYKESKFNIRRYSLILDKETDSLDNVQDVIDDYNQVQTCDPSNSLLGDPTDEDSVAWLLQKILNYIKILGPILVIVLSSFEFAKIIIQSDDEAMAKAQKKLIYRLILVAALFFIPTIVEALLQIFGITSDPTCGIR